MAKDQQMWRDFAAYKPDMGMSELAVVLVLRLPRIWWFEGTAKKGTKIYNARAKPLFCSLHFCLAPLLLWFANVPCYPKYMLDLLALNFAWLQFILASIRAQVAE